MREFPVSSFGSDSVSNFVDQAAQSINCDPCLVSLPTLAVLAASIGNSVRVEVKSGWEEPAIVWTMTVGPTGSAKSPAMDVALDDLRRRNIELIHRENSQLIIGDATIEAVGDVLESNPRGLLLDRDELSGWLDGMDQYKNGKGSERAQWLSIYNGGGLCVNRGRGKQRERVAIRNACVSIAGGIPPETLRRCLGTANFENGLASRFLMAMPEDRSRRLSSTSIDRSAKAAFSQIVEGLLSINGRSESPLILPLNKEAWGGFEVLHNQLEEERVALVGQNDVQLAAAIPKLISYIPRLALVLELTLWADSEQVELPSQVGKRAMALATRIVRWFRSEAERVYEVLGAKQCKESRTDLALRLCINAGGRIKPHILNSRSRRFKDADDAEKVLRDLERAKLGRFETSNGSGRPSLQFVLHGCHVMATS